MPTSSELRPHLRTVDAPRIINLANLRLYRSYQCFYKKFVNKEPAVRASRRNIRWLGNRSLISLRRELYVGSKKLEKGLLRLGLCYLQYLECSVLCDHELRDKATSVVTFDYNYQVGCITNGKVESYITKYFLLIFTDDSSIP